MTENQPRHVARELHRLLIPENLLSPHHESVRAEIRSRGGVNGIAVDAASSERFYLNYLVLTNWASQLPKAWRSDSMILYSRYFWFLRLTRSIRDRHGKDAGWEQQAHQILEQSAVDIDWEVIEAIEDKVNGAP